MATRRIGHKYSWLESPTVNGSLKAPPTLLDDNLNPKLAYFPVRDLLRSRLKVTPKPPLRNPRPYVNARYRVAPDTPSDWQLSAIACLPSSASIWAIAIFAGGVELLGPPTLSSAGACRGEPCSGPLLLELGQRPQR